jgi:hypothetical protein
VSQKYDGLSILHDGYQVYIKKRREKLCWAIGVRRPELKCLDLDWGGWWSEECEEFELMVVEPLLRWSD